MNEIQKVGILGVILGSLVTSVVWWQIALDSGWMTFP